MSVQNNDDGVMRCKRCECSHVGCCVAALVSGGTIQHDYSLRHLKTGDWQRHGTTLGLRGRPSERSKPQGAQAVIVMIVVAADRYCPPCGLLQATNRQGERGDQVVRAVHAPRRVRPPPSRTSLGRVSAQRHLEVAGGRARATARLICACRDALVCRVVRHVVRDCAPPLIGR